jgi:amylosucrase
MDIVLNHTSRHHEWAKKAAGDNYYWIITISTTIRPPDEFDKSMPEIFPNLCRNFTYVPECGKWVMTVFHSYQWDLNYANPR